MDRERIPQWIRNIVEIEKGDKCGICGKPIKFGEEYELDHIYPVSKGGSDTLDNLHVVHKSCNRKKGGKKTMVGSDQWNVWWSQIQPNLNKLRDNQIEAFNSTLNRFDYNRYPEEAYRIYRGCNPKIFCECTGGGKSILMLILGIFLARKRILIVTPSKVIRKGNFEALNDAHNLGIIPDKVFDEIKMLSLDKPNMLAYIHKADIVITTYQKLGHQDSDRVLANLRGDEFDVVLIDEAHHYKEGEKYEYTIHRDIVKKFKANSIILFFTATPFDAKLNPILKNFDPDKDVIHKFNYADAWHKGYVKYLEWTEIKPEEQTLVFTHPNGRTEQIKIKSEDLEEAKKIYGYKKALSKSRAMKLSLIYATTQLLEQRNAEIRRAKKNIALMVFPNKKEAEDCKKLMDTLNIPYKYCIIHSDIPERDDIIQDIKNDVYDIVLSVDIFKEGFDQKNITIVTLARKIESYVFFTQVIGRGVRARKDIYGNNIPVSGAVRNMKDICYVITHEGLDLRRFWELFRELDLADLVDEQEERENERRERGEPTEIIEDVTPILNIEGERVFGYISDGFHNGRTLRDETQAFYLVEAIRRGNDLNLKTVIEEVWRRDSGITLSQYFQQARSLDFADKRNIPNGSSNDSEDKKADFHDQTLEKAKKLQKLIRQQLTRSLKRKLTPDDFKLIANTFFEIYKHPLKGGTTKTGYILTPSHIEFINEEVPKLINKYKDPIYFEKHFLPVYKKNLQEFLGVKNN